MKKQEVGDTIRDYMMEYSKAVIMERAIVSLEDGLKPSQRLELWALHKSGTRSDSRRAKSLRSVGEAMKYIPHGDSGIYNAMARMSQSDTFLYPLIDGKGNMGTHTSRDTKPASPRYSEIRLSKFGEDLFENIEKDAVDFIDNFDNTLKQPTLFPTKFPSILSFNSEGIAVGYASKIPSFNIVEIVDATIKEINGEKYDYLIPDFPTGGKIIYNEKELKAMDDGGKGKLSVRARYIVDDGRIVITEIPYSTSREAIIEKILDLAKSGKLNEITDVRDSTGINGMSIEIDIRKNTNIELLMAKLYNNTPLQDNFNSNMNVIYKDNIYQTGVHDIIVKWLEFRKNTIRRMAKYDYNKKSNDLLYIEALNKVLLDIDKAIAIIKNSIDDNDTIEQLMKSFEISKEEAIKVSNFKLRNLNKSYISNKTKQESLLRQQTKNLKELIDSDEKIKEYIIQDLKNVKEKYGAERKTEVIYEDRLTDVIKILKEEIPDYNVKVFVTKENYVKKMALTSLRQAGILKLKDSDEIILEVETTNTEEILIFTDKQNVYKKRLSELEDCKPNQLGSYIPNEISLESGETILAVLPLSESSKYVLIGYEDGKVAKIDVESYRTKQNRSVLKNGYADKSALLFDILGTENVDIIAFADNKKVVLMNTETINSKSAKTTQGVTFIKLKDGCTVEKYEFAEKSELPEKEYYRLKSAGTGKYIKK